MQNLLIILVIFNCISCDNCVHKNDISKLNEKVVSLEDSIKSLQLFYKFSKISPLAVPVKMKNDTATYQIMMAVDGMLVGNSVVNLKVTSEDSLVQLRKSDGVYYYLKYPLFQKEIFDTLTLSYEFYDSNQSENHIFKKDLIIRH